jgi:hypothetical protein
VNDYEIRFVRADGRVALVYVTPCRNDLDAKAAADTMMCAEFGAAEIWRDLEHVATLRRERPAA